MPIHPPAQPSDSDADGDETTGHTKDKAHTSCRHQLPLRADLKRREPVHGLHRLQADCHDASHQVEDVPGVTDLS